MPSISYYLRQQPVRVLADYMNAPRPDDSSASADANVDKRFVQLEYETMAGNPTGYPQWAAWQSSDEGFRIYKRFGTLRNRMIARQHELAALEEELSKLDKEEEADTKRDFRVRWRVEDSDPKWVDLINEIDAKLTQYRG